MSWPEAFCGAWGEAELVDEIVACLVRAGQIELSELSSQFGHRFNSQVRASHLSPYSAEKRNDGSFKRWLKDCGFDVGYVYDGNKAMVYAPSGWEEPDERQKHSRNGYDYGYDAEAQDLDPWHDWADERASVELGKWGIQDAAIVDIVKKETLNVMRVPRICNGEPVHIHCLNLQENNFGDEGVEALVGYLTRNRIRIDILRLFKNKNVGSRSASKLAELYAQDVRPPPKELHLTHCAVGANGAADLLVAMARRWRTADRVKGKAAKPAYVRLDNNCFHLDNVMGKLQAANFYIRQGYDPRCRHSEICEVHEVGGGPALIMIPQMSLHQSHQRSVPSRAEWRYDEHAADEEPSDEAPRQAWKEKGPPEVVQESLENPPRDSDGMPIRAGCKVQYHNDSSWVGLVVGFDFKGTSVIDWQSGAKKGERTGAGGKYVRVVEDPLQGEVAKEAVLPKMQEASLPDGPSPSASSDHSPHCQRTNKGWVDEMTRTDEDDQTLEARRQGWASEQVVPRDVWQQDPQTWGGPCATAYYECADPWYGQDWMGFPPRGVQAAAELASSPYVAWDSRQAPRHAWPREEHPEPGRLHQDEEGRHSVTMRDLDHFVGVITNEDAGPPQHSPRIPLEVSDRALPDFQVPNDLPPEFKVPGFRTRPPQNGSLPQVAQHVADVAPTELPAAPSAPSEPPRAKTHVEKDPHDCCGVALCKGHAVQYHNDPSWLGTVVGFTAQDGVPVVRWRQGARAGSRTYAGGRFLRVVIENGHYLPLESLLALPEKASSSDSLPGSRRASLSGGVGVIGGDRQEPSRSPEALGAPGLLPLWAAIGPRFEGTASASPVSTPGAVLES